MAAMYVKSSFFEEQRQSKVSSPLKDSGARERMIKSGKKSPYDNKSHLIKGQGNSGQEQKNAFEEKISFFIHNTVREGQVNNRKWMI